MDNDQQFLASNNLMDYSLLFIKVKVLDHNPPLKRMPALIYVEDDDGERVLALREVSSPEERSNNPFLKVAKDLSGGTSGDLHTEFSHFTEKESELRPIEEVDDF